MTEWKTVKLSDLGEIIGGATPATSREDYYNGDIPWITPKDLAGYSGRYISRGERNITQAGLESCSTKLMPKNTILFSSRAPIGYIAIAKNDICTNQGFKSIVPNADMPPLFLYYLLKYYKDEIEAMGSGTTFKEVSGSTMRNITVRIPVAVEIQERIADILDSLDSKIENNNHMNDNLEQQCISKFHCMFDKYVIQQSCYVSLGEVASFKYGTMPKKDKLNSGEYLAFSGYQIVGNYPEKMFSEPQLIIVARGVGGCGDVKYTPSNCYLTNLSIAILTDSTEYDDFLYYYLSSHDTRVLNTGSAQPQITISTLEKFLIPLPPRDELITFSKFVALYKEMHRNNIKENQLLSKLRDSILPKLMSGELDVSEIDF